MRPALIMLLLSAGCSASASVSTETPVDSPLEREWQSYREQSALPTSTAGGGGELQAMLKTKLAALKKLEATYDDLRKADDLGSQAQAGFASGRLYLNLACELITLGPPAGLDTAQETAWRGALLGSARPMFAKAQDHLTTASRMDAGAASERAAQLVAEPDEPPLGLCRRTAEHWAATTRPEPAPMSAEDCATATRSLDAAPKHCRQKLVEACRGGDDVCDEAARLVYEEGGVEKAHQLWSIGCDDHGRKAACGARSLVALPGSSAAYADECRRGDVLGCLRLARVQDLKSGVQAGTCQGKAVMSDKSPALDACEAGDAAACWSVVAAELKKAPMPPIEGLGGILGSLLAGGEPSDEEIATFRANCEKGSGFSCTQMAATVEGAARLPWLEKACALKVGCGDLGADLVELGTEVERGTRLLVSDCVDQGRGYSCSRAADLFMAGKKVPRSASCAVALSLHTCTPTDPWNCASVNDLFR